MRYGDKEMTLATKQGSSKQDVDEGQQCEVEQSERQGNIISDDMLRDKGASRLRGEEKCSSRGGSGRSELGELLLVYFNKYRQAKY